MALTAKQFLSVTEAALLIGVTDSRVRQMLRKKKLVGEKLNQRAWAVDPKSAAKAAKETDVIGPGRPRSGR